MRVITIIEDDEGVFVVTTTGETYACGIDLLHKGIRELIKAAGSRDE